MNIEKYFKRIMESMIGTYVVFFIANLLLIFFISFMFWLALISGDPYDAGYRRWVSTEIPCPTCIYPYKDILFIEVFIMCSGLYFGMIGIIFVIMLLNNHHQTKRIDKI